ncbi:MAG: HAD family hydrolase [Ideonella sp. WA131b]|nr:HAD family hydrolase [Ideonella sp. WA131b]
MLSPSLVIFDCDGVLVDSELLSHSVLREMIAEFGVDLTLEETLEHFMGTSTEKCLEVLNSLVGQSAPADFFHQFRTRTFAAFARDLTSVQGAPELLAALHVPYCVASNGPREKMRFTLGHTGLLPLVEGRLFSAQDVARPKPAPDLFLNAAASLGAQASSCVVIEDSPTGVAAARAAGMVVYGFAAMGQSKKLFQAGAQLVFGSMSELPALLGSAQ